MTFRIIISDPTPVEPVRITPDIQSPEPEPDAEELIQDDTEVDNISQISHRILEEQGRGIILASRSSSSMSKFSDWTMGQDLCFLSN